MICTPRVQAQAVINDHLPLKEQLKLIFQSKYTREKWKVILENFTYQSADGHVVVNTAFDFEDRRFISICCRMDERCTIIYRCITIIFNNIVNKYPFVSLIFRQ